ncbi:MAG: YXWGXW repeat-containing protein [Chitinophaga sp.]|uniref:YXWGXW repeat-containing protein n=1 Tax=Chitinophaga sp. TaxID=1869181 RepID=UPI0025BD09CE|nr:YXWGXW repeat-containing protein [Chitinophaga sp.]MBV8253671.1 YXWGXW repeat-containing protein [Chitinophaga sp.]
MNKQSFLFRKTQSLRSVSYHLFSGRTLLLLFSLFALSCTTTRGQDDTYYTGDQAVVTIQTQTAPPPIPDYVQPPCPGDGYYWIPGYWAWSSNGYYWVPGVWVLPPSPGLLWTPGYWAFYGGYYGWHPGYWGTTVGYYGGINYGFGYFGTGFYGGRWEGRHFHYNTAVWRVGGGIHNTYVNRVNITNTNHVSYNGRGGVNYRPTDGERQVIHQDRTPPHQLQMQHEQNFMNERGQFHAPNRAPAVHSMNMPGGERFDQRGRSMGMGGHGGGRGRRD